MNIQIVGTVEYVDIGTGAWAIATDTNQQYEILQPAPSELLEDGLKVSVTAKIRDDVMSMAMVGDIIEILDFQISA
ncbi:MAG: hypothetical protein ACOYN8_08635 [Pseudanabaena sp.]|jgi:hypothetical protein